METNNIINSNINSNNNNNNINNTNNNNNNISINNNIDNNKITNQNNQTNNNNNNKNNINTNNITNNNISTFDDSTISIKMNEIKLKPSSSDTDQNIFSNINSNQNNNINKQKTDLLETINEETTKYIEDMKKGTYNILVAVRCRPLSNKEKEFSLTETINILERKVIILKDPNALINNPNNTRSKEQTMAFDFAFNKNENQFEIFNNTTKFLIDGVVNGFNATVFAYGATGAGKTYTMLGTEENPGIMPLTLKELFKKIKSYPERDYTVKLWYLEIYNENIRDLLNNNTDEYLDLREDPNKGIIVSGITEITTNSSEHILSILKKGNKNRTTEATNANETSSRSHAILQILVSYKEKTSSAIEYEIKYGKLSLIDLAGSERASVTQNQGIRLFEGANINRSLLTLGNCIKALCESAQKGKQIYVPYRDSKLTRLLKDSLGGNSRTVMIANISPSVKAYDDTYNTLNFANKAKNIKTSIKRNVLNAQYHISNYVNIIKNLQSRIFELEGQIYKKRDLTASPKQRKRQGTPVSSNKRNYNNSNNNLNNNNVNTNNNNNSICGDGSGRNIENNNNKIFENLVNEIKNLCDNELKLKQKVITQQIDIYNKINQIKKEENNNNNNENINIINNENEEEKKKIKEQKKIWEKNLVVLKEISNSIKNFLEKNLSNSLLSNMQKDYLSMIVKNNKNKIANFDIKFKLILLKNQSEDKNNYINLLEKQILLRDNILIENKITHEDFSKEIKEKYKTIQQLHNEFNNSNNNNYNNNNDNNISQPFSSKNVHSNLLSNPNSNNNNNVLNRSSSNKDCTDKNNININNNNNVHLPPLSGNNSGLNTLTNLNSVLSDIKELNVKINNISNISKNQNNSYIKDINNNLQFQNIQINNNRPNTQQNNIANNNNNNIKRGGNDRLQKIRRYSNNIRNINTNNNNNNNNYNYVNTNNYINTPLKYNNNNSNNKNKNFFTRNNIINNNIPGSAKQNNRIFKGNNNNNYNNNYNNINNLTDNSLRKLNGIRNNLYNEYNSYTIDYNDPLNNNNNNNININNYLPNDMKISEEIENSTSMKNDFSQSLNNNNNHSHNNILNNNNNQTYNLKLKNNLSHSSSNNSMKGLSYLNHSRSQSKEYSKRKNDNNNNNIRIKEMSPYRMQNKRKIPFKI